MWLSLQTGFPHSTLPRASWGLAPRLFTGAPRTKYTLSQFLTKLENGRSVSDLDPWTGLFLFF